MITDEPYKAPIPLTHEVDDVKLRPIKAKLKADPPEPITMEEATLLLQSTTYLAIKGLSQVYDSRQNWKEIITSGKSRWNVNDGGIETQVIDRERDLYHGHTPRHWGRFVRIKCDNAMNLADMVLQELPDSMVCCTGTQYFAFENHTMLILSLPIIEKGAVTERHFLIDPTLGQFFYKDSASDTQHHVGERMMAQDADFANTLLSQGYSELTESRAKTYVTSFAPQLLGQRAQDAWAECNGSHSEFLRHDLLGFKRLPIYDHPVAGDDTIQR